MKADEVPQEGLDYKDRDKLRKLMYATDGDGNYTGIPSKGWEAENTATEAAWQEMEETMRETVEAVRSGHLSPIAYYMQKCLMDVAILAGYVGKWQWTVKRHLKADVFKRLSEKTLGKYAGVFGITVQQLKHPDLI